MMKVICGGLYNFFYITWITLGYLEDMQLIAPSTSLATDLYNFFLFALFLSVLGRSLWCVCSSSLCHVLSSLSITSADSVDLGQVSRTCGTGGLDCRGVGQQQQPPNSPPPLSPFGDLRLNKGQRSNWCCGLAIKAIKKNIDFDC